MEKYTLDAEGKSLGRVATEAAMILMGKNRPNYVPNLVADVAVEIVNASKISLSKGKLSELYERYSGYPGGRKVRTREEAIEKKGYDFVFINAVRGMIPNNKLRPLILKNLTVTQ